MLKTCLCGVSEKNLVILLSLLPLFLGPSRQTHEETAEFARLLRGRAHRVASSHPDSQIAMAAGKLSFAIRENLRDTPRPSEKQVDAWIRPFLQAANLAPDQVLPDEFGSIDAQVFLAGANRYIVVRLGAMSHTDAIDRQGHLLPLPPEFRWNVPWLPKPTLLPSGILLMDESRIQAAGMLVGRRILWLRGDQIVGRFEGADELDRFETRIRGNRVSVTTIDDPKCFMVSMADHLFERVTTWDCRGPKPVRVGLDLKQKPLRAVDLALFEAWHAKHPSSLQQRMRRLWPAEQGELDSWRSTPTSVTLNKELEFTLKGDRVLRVKHL